MPLIYYATVILLKYNTKYMPTREQLLMAVQVCHLLSEMMQPIEVFLYTKRNAQFFLIAGRKANIRITLYPDLTMEMEIDV